MSDFVNTINNMGYMTTTLDEFSLYFIESCRPEMRVFEAGAAFGVATIPILKTGAYVTANDLEKQHLEAILLACPENLRDNLTLAPGPIETLSFEESLFDGVFTSRMLHLLKGDDVEKTVRHFFQWMKKGGKLVALVDTPFLGCYAKNLPSYQAKLEKGEKWPGLIEDTSIFMDILYNNIPKFINFIDLPTLERVIKEAGFSIEKAGYIKQSNFPKELQLDGRESAGVIAIKPECY